MKAYYFLSMLACLTIHAAPISFQSSENQTTLVELYTSEGCSSCPPAESWLSEWKTAPGLWKDFVPVAFHVDYWDYLGWRDKWASKQFSERQRAYADVWATESVYTPGLVLNGKEWRDWFRQKTIPAGAGQKAGLLTIKTEDGRHWKASFVRAAGGASSYEAYAALLLSDLSSDVKAGENAGRQLKHDFAALTLVKQPLAAGDGGFSGEFTLEADPKAAHGRLAVAVWVTRAGSLEPLQAVGGWLPEPEKK